MLWCLQVKGTALEAMAGDSLNTNQDLVVQGSQLSGPAHLDLRVSPKKMVFWSGRWGDPWWSWWRRRFGLAGLWCSTVKLADALELGCKDSTSMEDHGSQNDPELPFAHGTWGWRPTHHPSIWSGKPVLSALKLMTFFGWHQMKYLVCVWGPIVERESIF